MHKYQETHVHAHTHTYIHAHAHAHTPTLSVRLSSSFRKHLRMSFHA